MKVNAIKNHKLYEPHFFNKAKIFPNRLLNQLYFH